MTHPPVVTFVFMFMLGACIGSFLNVVIHRLPAGQSIVFPPSHCPSCGKSIPFYLNIPILSYLILMGKCRFCRTRIPFRYPAVEFITGGMALILFLHFSISIEMAFWLFFTSVLIAVSVIDLDHQIIPDRISLPGIVIFSASAFIVPDMTLTSTALGILAGGGILYLVALAYYLVRRQEGMGGGDIKLLAMIGAATGIKGVIFTLFAGSLLGTLGGGASLIFTKQTGAQAKIPFGPFLSAGAIIYVLWGDQIIHWYLFR